MIKAVIFDMDGLIIDSEPFWRETEKTVFSKVGIHLTDAMCRSTMGLRLDNVVSHWYKQKPWTGPLKKDIETDILLGVSELVLTKGTSMPGALNLFQFFNRKNIPLALASSSPLQLIHTILSKLKIRDYFQSIHSAETEPFGKPHPAIFITAAKSLRVEPPECLVFEDSYLGAIAAKAARMQTILVPSPEEQKLPRNILADLEISSLEQFGDIQLNQLNNLKDKPSLLK